jgi:hypothetical protein
MKVLLMVHGGTKKEIYVGEDIVNQIVPLLSDYAEVQVYVGDEQKNVISQTTFDYVLTIHFHIGRQAGIEMQVLHDKENTRIEEMILTNLQLFYENHGIKKTTSKILTAANKHGEECALIKLCFMDTMVEMYESCKERIGASITAGIVSGLRI